MSHRRNVCKVGCVIMWVFMTVALPVTRGFGQASGTFPAEPLWQGLQITYSVSGASITATYDGSHLRSLEGNLTSGQLSVSGSAKATKPECPYYTSIMVQVWVGNDTKIYKAPDPVQCETALDSYSFSVSVPIPKGANSGGFAINEEYHNRWGAGTSLEVGGDFRPANTCQLTCWTSVPNTGQTGFPIAFNATATPSGCSGTVSYEWDFGDNSPHSFDQTAGYAYTQEGTYTWTMIAKVGNTECRKTGTITISPCQLTCSASVPTTGQTGDTIAFNATATSSGCSGTVSYEWDFGDNSPHSSDQNTAHNYTQEGTYTWTMIAKVGSTECRKTGTIIISSSPTCQLTCSATVPTTGKMDDTIAFNAMAAPSGCSGTVSYEWDFGDNSPHSSDQNTAHNYTQEGTYTWTMIAKVGSTECSETDTITIIIAGIKITNITVQGLMGTPGGLPETGSIVRMVADIEIAEGYEVTECIWTGDLTPGEGEPQNYCVYDYTPSTGIGPDIATYGNKNVTLTVSYTDTTTGMSGTVSQDHSYKVFFNRDADDQLRENPIPNWFEYWGANGAVPQLSQADVRFDPTMGDSSYGCYNCYGDDMIDLGAGASKVHYPGGIYIPDGPDCAGGNFGGAEGIDCATEVVEHEGRHKWIRHNWDAGGIWAGRANSDFEAQGLNDDRDYNDNLPDDYEISEIQTSPYVTDSCDVENYKNEIYKYYGDNEYAVMVYSNGKTGDPEKDWANPGKQANRLPGTVTQGQGQFQTDKVFSKSGPTDSKNLYHSYTTGAARDIAWLTGSYSDSGIDSDGNGLYNHLKLSVGIEAASSALYVNVVAWLKDGNGNDIAWANTSGKLSTGVQTVNLFFDGRVIRKKGLDGPYKIAHVELRTGEAEDLIDTGDNVHTTAAYHYTDFDTSDVSFTKSFSDSGVDNNSDGLYDFLRILVGIDVQKAGTYTVIGEFKKGSESIAVARTSASLMKGNQTVNLDFSGGSIYQCRQDGPYELKALRIEDMSRKKVDAIYNAYTTRDYTYGQFQHSGTSIDADSYDDECIDLNDDGICEYLRVSFEINVAEAGFYRVSATLKDSQGETITSQLREINLSTVNGFIELDFLGRDINSHKVDGPYQVTSVTLLSANGTLVDFQPKAYTTSDWSYLDFGGEGGPYTLTITKSGTGSGTVTSSPAGINCGSDCTEAYDQGTLVSLTATPSSGSTFGGWSGACSGKGGCSVTMNSDKTVTATFTLTQKPNLTPYQPTKTPPWSDKIVVSNVTGTHTDSSPLYTTDELFVDFAVVSDNNVAITSRFYVALYVDGVFINNWYWDSLPSGYHGKVEDYSIGSLSAGTHTIKIVADSTGVIDESNESDNEYTKTITVTNPNGPDLTGEWISVTQSCKYTSKGKSCKITGSLKIENIGNRDAPSSYVEIYVFGDVEDHFIKRVSTGKLKAKKSKTLKISYTLPAGGSASGGDIYAFIDIDDTVDETDEDNNLVIYTIP